LLEKGRSARKAAVAEAALDDVFSDDIGRA
jgi:hypothetical protein